MLPNAQKYATEKFKYIIMRKFEEMTITIDDDTSFINEINSKYNEGWKFIQVIHTYNEYHPIIQCYYVCVFELCE